MNEDDIKTALDEANEENYISNLLNRKYYPNCEDDLFITEDEEEILKGNL